MLRPIVSPVSGPAWSAPARFARAMGDSKRLKRSVFTGAVASIAMLSLLGAGCSSSSDSSNGEGSASGDSERTTTTMSSAPFNPHSPDEVSLVAGGPADIAVPQPAAALPEGYLMEEYFVGGTATSFSAIDMSEDGRWVAEPDAEAPYRTRVIVRRPLDPAAFSGTVVVEWFNVSAIEAAPDWTYLATEIAREGHAYIGVSAQRQGIEGGETILSVEVDDQQAAAAGVDADPSGIKNTDPERYGTLAHPGDAYSFDMFSQVGRVAQASPQSLLGDLVPTQVIAAGESQSAMFMSTLVNAVHPLSPVFDGFLIHSRASLAAPLDGDYAFVRELREGGQGSQFRTTIRDDLDVPVLLFVTETDLTALRYSEVRQPDSARIRTWEVAGTAHADAHLLRALLGGPRDPGIGAILGCGPINTGPHMEVLTAGFHHLVAWTAGGEAPPTGALLELEPGDEVALARDPRGNALGGVRNPLIDVPIARIDGDPVATEGGSDELCSLFGSTEPFDQATLLELYGSADEYVRRFRESAAVAVGSGFLLQSEADALIEEAEANRSLF